MINSFSRYPDPGSNRDGLPHWCLRPARLPIPPSGLKCDGKGSESFYTEQKNVIFFAFRGLKVGCFVVLRRENQKIIGKVGRNAELFH